LEGLLAGRFPQAARADVSRLVEEARRRYAGTQDRTYVPTVVEPEVREHLRSLIQRAPSSADRDPTPAPVAPAEQAFSSVAGLTSQI
jgi:hypothetical protein